MTGCLYFSTSSVKAAVSPCFTRSIRAASGSRVGGMGRKPRPAQENTGRATRLQEKFQSPTSNTQRSTKHQAPRAENGFDDWNLEFLWSLEVGAWMLSPACLPRHLHPKLFATCSH